MLLLNFNHISCPRDQVNELWQAMLWIEGEFTVSVYEGTLVDEPHWNVLELAVQLCSWLALATDVGPSFVYSSMDAEQEGLLRFDPVADKHWKVGSAWGKCRPSTLYTFSQIRAAARRFSASAIEASAKYLSEDLKADLCGKCA